MRRPLTETSGCCTLRALPPPLPYRSPPATTGREWRGSLRSRSGLRGLPVCRGCSGKRSTEPKVTGSNPVGRVFEKPCYGGAFLIQDEPCESARRPGWQPKWQRAALRERCSASWRQKQLALPFLVRQQWGRAAKLVLLSREGAVAGAARRLPKQRTLCRFRAGRSTRATRSGIRSWSPRSGTSWAASPTPRGASPSG